MENAKNSNKPLNSKGAAIFQVMLDDKKAIHEHLQHGGALSDILNEIKQNHDAIRTYLNNGGKLEDYKGNKAVN